MKKLTSMLTIAVLATALFGLQSCNGAPKEHNTEVNMDENHSEMEHDNTDGNQDRNKNEMEMNANNETNSEMVLKDYFNLKDALVADDNAKAKEFGGLLAESLKELDISKFTETQKTELTDIIEDATEHAEHISDSPIDHQREHFKILSTDITDMIEITGTENTLYQQYCPMYDGGSAWLSTSENVLNPYYGSKMLKCGKVQKEIK